MTPSVQLEAAEGAEPNWPQMQWARCRPWLVEAVANGPGLTSIEAITEGVETCRLVFWAGQRCAWITRIDEWTNAKVMTVCLAGGDINDPHQLDNLELQVFHVAAHLGCAFVGFEADEATAEILKGRGFKHAFTTMLKPVQPRGPLPRPFGTGNYGGGNYDSRAPKPAASEKDAK